MRATAARAGDRALRARARRRRRAGAASARRPARFRPVAGRCGRPALPGFRRANARITLTGGCLRWNGERLAPARPRKIERIVEGVPRFAVDPDCPPCTSGAIARYARSATGRKRTKSARSSARSATFTEPAAGLQAPGRGRSAGRGEERERRIDLGEVRQHTGEVDPPAQLRLPVELQPLAPEAASPGRDRLEELREAEVAQVAQRDRDDFVGRKHRQRRLSARRDCGLSKPCGARIAKRAKLARVAPRVAASSA